MTPIRNAAAAPGVGLVRGATSQSVSRGPQPSLCHSLRAGAYASLASCRGTPPQGPVLGCCAR